MNKRKLPKETSTKQKNYKNVAAIVMLNAIVEQYEAYAEDKGVPLTENEKDYVKSLYTTLNSGTGGSQRRRYTKVSCQYA